ncbi:serine/threonine-protein kinase [Frigoribacterium sp. MEB024]|uniref:serine/threonine-protein kinase n=1 Tax=Frigoribacterium sp. MEB024 TaxID=1589899 RepID=UPI0005B968FE|nr:serine/threonine-protein kinase [Frigoribacterium sp. MEB024]KIU03053.1 hypothetical protein SZ60_07205 [Frigoribacterium sp. MEB024]
MPDQTAVFRHLSDQYSALPPSEAYAGLYTAMQPPLPIVFGALHERLNALFLFMNSKMDRGRHFNAEQSRDLIDLIEEIREVRGSLGKIGIDIRVREDYQRVLNECSAFLVVSGGSPIPESFAKIDIDRFDPVFVSNAWQPPTKTSTPPKKTMVGEGSYAIVYKYTDETYGFPVAVKVGKKNLDERELSRFKAEFQKMKELNYPYIVQAYQFDESHTSFTMEFCDYDLRNFMHKYNGTLQFATRKRLALQFLYAMGYLHRRGILHRDLSTGNVLIKEYEEAFLVKLSDFGLHKAEGSEFTKSDTEMKGSIRDPTLASLKEFAKVNDIHAVGHILAFMFTGRSSIAGCPPAIQAIVDKCVHNDPTQRYQDISEVIADLELATE